MTTVVNLRKILDRKAWEPVAPMPTASLAGAFNISSSLSNRQLFVAGVSAMYQYDPSEDGFLLLPASGLAGTFGAGTCGVHHPAGPSGTASAGSSSTITTTLTTAVQLPGNVIRITAGTGAGQERLIASNTVGTNAVFTMASNWAVAPDATSVYIIYSGRWYIFNAGTLAAGSFRQYDIATNTWSAGLSTTGVPATWGTDGRLIVTPGAASNPFTRETARPATAASATTLTDSARTWTVDQWKNATVYIKSGTGAGQRSYILNNTSTILTLRDAFTTVPDATSVYEIEAHTATSATGTTLTDGARAWASNQYANQQVRILSGTGVGQVRTIVSNTATALTVAAWSTTPDSTSTYIIEGDDNAMYLMGNSAVTMYKYSISANTWATLAPGVARGAAPGLAASGHWVSDSDDPVWRDETQIVNGRRIYSLRGGAAVTLDYYDIATNAWTNAVAYAKAAETFTTGTGYALVKDKLYIQQNASGRWFRLDFALNKIDPWGTLVYPQGAAVIGDKVFDVLYQDGSTTIRWIYHWVNTGLPVFRCMII